MNAWINWLGGEQPIPDGTIVDVKFRDGEKMIGVVAGEYVDERPRDAVGQFWQNYGDSCDIVAYRVHVPTEEADTLSEVLAERGSRYGSFTKHAEVTQGLKTFFRCKMGEEKWDYLAHDQREALEMIAHKLGRIINGDPNYADSWVDIAGYARLVADRLEGE